MDSLKCLVNEKRQKYKLTDRNTGWLCPNPPTADQQEKKTKTDSGFGILRLHSQNTKEVFKKQIFEKHSSVCLSSSDAGSLSWQGLAWNLIIIIESGLFCFCFSGSWIPVELEWPFCPRCCLVCGERDRGLIAGCLAKSIQKQRKGKRKRTAKPLFNQGECACCFSAFILNVPIRDRLRCTWDCCSWIRKMWLLQKFYHTYLDKQQTMLEKPMNPNPMLSFINPSPSSDFVFKTLSPIITHLPASGIKGRKAMKSKEEANQTSKLQQKSLMLV